MPRLTLGEVFESQKRLAGQDLRSLDLRGVDLSGADLKGADLSQAILSGVDLSGADLTDADLSQATLTQANLKGADLSQAILIGANLKDADLSQANLSNANLYGANYKKANLHEANVTGTKPKVKLKRRAPKGYRQGPKKENTKKENPQKELARLIRQSDRAYSAYRYRNSPFLEDINDNSKRHIRQTKNIVTAKQVDWEILPPGWWHNPYYRHQLESRFKSKEQAQLFLERLEFIETLNHKEIYRSRFNDRGSPYYVFVFSHCVVAENPLDGNAIYVIRGSEDWQNLLMLNKKDLIELHGDSVRKIVHRGDWQHRLRREVLRKTF